MIHDEDYELPSEGERLAAEKLRERELAALKRDFFRAWTAARSGAHQLGPGSLHCCQIKARELRVPLIQIQA